MKDSRGALTDLLARVARVAAIPLRSVRRRTPRGSRLRRNAVRGVRIALDEYGVQPYQPLFGISAPSTTNQRDRGVGERWDLLDPVLPRSGSALDVGCQYGWFTFKLAERGLNTIGIDDQLRTIEVARALTLTTTIASVGFWRLNVDLDSARSLPDVETMLLMSVFHHWARSQGQDYAEKLLRAVVAHCSSHLVFETGGPLESAHEWSSTLDFMLPDPNTYSENLLRDAGFADVRRLGSTSGYQHIGSRVLFLASRVKS